LFYTPICQRDPQVVTFVWNGL